MIACTVFLPLFMVLAAVVYGKLPSGRLAASAEVQLQISRMCATRS